MAVIKQIEARRAYRALAEEPIPPETLIRLVQAAHLAPSCANSQSWRIVTVVDRVPLDALKATLSSGNYWAKKSPAIAAFVSSLESRLGRSHGRRPR